jgi:hypothetical protein
VKWLWQLSQGHLYKMCCGKDQIRKHSEGTQHSQHLLLRTGKLENGSNKDFRSTNWFLKNGTN